MPTSARSGYIGIGKQTSKGTGVAATQYVRWQGRTDMSPKQGFTQYKEGGDGTAPGIVLKENHKPDGQFGLLARPSIMGILYALALGADSVSGAAAPYTHAITPSDTLPWASIERQVGGIQNRIVDCRIKSITLEGEAGKPVRATVEYVGISDDASVADASESYESNLPFVFFNGTYTWDGSATTVIERFRVTLRNNFDEEFFTSSVTRNDVPLLDRDVELECTISMEDSMAFYKSTYLGASTTAGTTIDSGAFIIDLTYGTSTAVRGLKVEIPTVNYTEAPVELNSDGERTRYEIRGVANKASGSNLINVTVKSSDTTAYV